MHNLVSKILSTPSGKRLRTRGSSRRLQEQKKKFLEAVKRAYKEIIDKGVLAKSDRDILKYVSNTKLAKKLGIPETVNKILPFMKRKEAGVYVLKVATTPAEHFLAMDVPGSCQRASGTRSHGALATARGPPLVFYVMDPTGRVIGRTTLYLYEGPKEELLFVPNNSYGHVNVRKTATEILKQYGIPVHEDIKPPATTSQPRADSAYGCSGRTEKGIEFRKAW